MYIERNEYIEKLNRRKWNGRVKVIAGLRRSGKSFLLFELFKKQLISEGVNESNIISLALDSLDNTALTDPYVLYDYIKDKITDKSEAYYVFLDEIQYTISPEELRQKDIPPRIYGVLNGLLQMKNVDVYVTGSNSKLLSEDIMTEFRGRGDVVSVFPLSFKEFLPASGKNKEEAFNDYMLYGGLPLVLSYSTMEEKAAYLESLFSEIYLKDIIERYRITKPEVLSNLVNVVCFQTGSLTNISKITDTVNSMMRNKKDERIAHATISSYFKYLMDSFLFSEAKRYDIRGKSYFDGISKYYPTDTGLRNARLNFRQIEETHLMENIIFNYLKSSGFRVDVGVIVKNRTDKDGKHIRVPYEIDFVVNKGMYQYYIQSAFRMENAEKMEQELYPFSITGNSFKKIVVTRHELLPHYDDELLPHYDEKGIFHVGITDFLLGDYLKE